MSCMYLSNADFTYISNLILKCGEILQDKSHRLLACARNIWYNPTNFHL